MTTILHIVANLEPTLEAHAVVDLALATQRVGGRTVIASAGGSLVIEAERVGIRHFSLSSQHSNRFLQWRRTQSLAALIQKVHPHLIHIHDLGQLVNFSGWHASIPVIIDAGTLTPPTVNTAQILSAMLQKGAHVRVPTESMRTWLIERWGLQAHNTQIQVIRPGLDQSWYTSRRVTPERARRLAQEWRLPEQAHVALMAAPLSVANGQHRLLQALKSLGDVPLCVVLIGDDRQSPGMRAKLESAVASWGLSGRVIMPESCADWPAAMWLASCYVALNSAPKGNFLQILAAQAMGRPVIVTPCDLYHEIIDEDETACVVPADDVEALAQALQKVVLLDSEKRVALVESAHHFVAQTFPQHAWIRGMFDLYHHVLTQ